MEINKIREKSLQLSESLGVLTNRGLPLLETSFQLKSENEIFKRLMCLHVIAACAYGFERKKGKEWLVQEDIVDALTSSEIAFLSNGTGDKEKFKEQIEGMWALSWVLGLTQHLDFSRSCDANFVTFLPNLKLSQPISSIKAKVNPRSLHEVVEACDLAYCLHWGIQEARITMNPLPAGISPAVVIERRRALEWAINDDAWDDILLDT